MLNKLKKTVNDSIKEHVSDLKESVKEHAVHLTDAVKDKTSELTDAMKESVKEHVVHFSDAVKDKASELTESVKEHTTNIVDAVKDKTLSLIEDWLKIFPNLEQRGLKISAFGMRMSMNLGIECELTGLAKNFTVEKIENILEEVKGNVALTTVFKAIKNTYAFHKKTGTEQKFNKIFLKITVQMLPEVIVYLGEPKLM